MENESVALSSVDSLKIRRVIHDDFRFMVDVGEPKSGRIDPSFNQKGT